MDTSQRDMGLRWDDAKELIGRTLDAAGPSERDRVFSGVGTDPFSPDEARSTDDMIRTYLEQFQTVQSYGGGVILMASRALARVADGPWDYAEVYRQVLTEADHPVILPWLGEMFDPTLKGYWGAERFNNALETTLGVIADGDTATFDAMLEPTVHSPA